MSEEEHLSLLRQLTQDLESGRRTFIIEVDEQVVSDEGERIGTLKVVFNGGYT